MQAINLKLLPDSRTQSVKSRIVEDIQARLNRNRGDSIDMSPYVKYARNNQENKQHAAQEAEKNLEAEQAAEELEDTSKKEYIFLIDRSGSMHQRIKLARQALILFLQSLPAGSKFNVCSYGSWHDSIFPGRSVDYNDDNMETAITKIAEFAANYGGTKIYEPLADILSEQRPSDCEASHIYLLTDGAIWDTKKVVDLVESKSNMN